MESTTELAVKQIDKRVVTIPAKLDNRYLEELGKAIISAGLDGYSLTEMKHLSTMGGTQRDPYIIVRGVEFTFTKQ